MPGPADHDDDVDAGRPLSPDGPARWPLAVAAVAVVVVGFAIGFALAGRSPSTDLVAGEAAGLRSC